MLELAWIAASAAAAPIFVIGRPEDDEPGTEISAGISAGIHDLDLPPIGDGPRFDSNGTIFGAFVAVDKPVRDKLFAGAEANLHLGSGAISSDLGASLRFGYRAESGTKAYVRGGYQWVSVNRANLMAMPDPVAPMAAPDPAIAGSVNNYLVGFGLDFPVYRKVQMRINFDSLGFQTLRATTGVAYTF